MKQWSVYYIWGIFLIALVSFVGVIMFSAPNQANAQITESEFIFSFDPPVPGANEEVTAELKSLAVNLERLLITWIIDGKTRKSGIGERTVTFMTGENGSETTVDVFIQLSNGDVFRRRAILSPATITLLWETTQSYTPPFYRGKALPAPEEVIKVVALPTIEDESVETLENSMVFNWEHNNRRLPDQSGYGENPLYIRNDVLRDTERIQLTALHRNGYSQGRATIAIPITTPRITLYREVEGAYRAINRSVRIGSGTEVLRAEPFFFSVSRRTLNLLDYVWTINERVITSNTSPRDNELAVVGQEEDGLSLISIAIEHPLKILQAAQLGPVTINFGQ